MRWRRPRPCFRHSDLDAEQIARTSMEIAASICIYTNDRITVISLRGNGE